MKKKAARRSGSLPIIESLWIRSKNSLSGGGPNAVISLQLAHQYGGGQLHSHDGEYQNCHDT
jgi:hypothetical protein